MKSSVTSAFISILTLVLYGCGGNVKQQNSGSTSDPFPAWVSNPNMEAPNALNSANCVEIHGSHMDLAKKRAVANGKAEIAGQVKTMINSQVKDYNLQESIGRDVNVESSFEDTNKQVIDETLGGIAVIKSSRVVDKDATYYCTLSSLNTDKLTKLTSQIAKSIK